MCREKWLQTEDGGGRGGEGGARGAQGRDREARRGQHPRALRDEFLPRQVDVLSGVVHAARNRFRPRMEEEEARAAHEAHGVEAERLAGGNRIVVLKPVSTGIVVMLKYDKEQPNKLQDKLADLARNNDVRQQHHRPEHSRGRPKASRSVRTIVPAPGSGGEIFC